MTRARQKIRKTIKKVKQACIDDYGQNFKSLEDFEDKLQKNGENRRICGLNEEIEQCVLRAIQGEKPGLVITKEDDKLN